MKSEHERNHNKHYGHLVLMTVLSFISMYVFMYSMVNSFSNVYSNINQFYMAGVMTAPMVMIELVLMREMYMNKKINALIFSVGLIALIGFFLLIRYQVAVTDKQFLKSMIPHHAGAVLMCEQAPIEGPAIRDLCKGIISSQTREIEQMKAMLNNSGL